MPGVLGGRDCQGTCVSRRPDSHGTGRTESQRRRGRGGGVAREGKGEVRTGAGTVRTWRAAPWTPGHAVTPHGLLWLPKAPRRDPAGVRRPVPHPELHQGPQLPAAPNRRDPFANHAALRAGPALGRGGSAQNSGHLPVRRGPSPARDGLARPLAARPEALATPQASYRIYQRPEENQRNTAKAGVTVHRTPGWCSVGCPCRPEPP